MSEKLANNLKQDLHWQVRQQFEACYQAMNRELDFEISTQRRYVDSLTQAGWQPEKLRVVIILNCFNRVVLGPLTAVCDRDGRRPLGNSISIQYGEFVTVNAVTIEPIKTAIDNFFKISRMLGVMPAWLSASKLSDLLYQMNKSVSDGN